MKMNKPYSTNLMIRYAILFYWSLFWLFNIIDKIIGGSHFLWVGRDRFAQFQKFFASTGLDSPIIADLALVIAAALEIFAFVFFTGALFFFFKKKSKQSRDWFFKGIVFTLLTFTVFAIGDHIFGDRFELLEHTLFWFLTLFSWGVFIHLDDKKEDSEIKLNKAQILLASSVTIVLITITSISVFSYSKNYFYQRSSPVKAEQINTDIYKVSFPFLGGSTVFENSIRKFQEDNPSKEIDHIYTVPSELRLKKADGLIFYIVTKDCDERK